jgi:hypothetical protein
MGELNVSTGVYTEYTQDQINENTALTNEHKKTYYIEERAVEYPSIQEQLDMQYWDAVNGTTTWRDAIAKVKADNPKP